MGVRVGVKTRVTARVVDLFSHSDKPLEHTARYPGDSGLFGPDSISWEVLGDVSSFVGGIRALMIQAAHPEVVAGVADHSRYREDPLGRLSRTSYFVTSMNYGAEPEIEAAVQIVNRAHSGVVGISERGTPYDASDPEYSAWVHNTLTDSFLEAFQRFRRPLSGIEADTFVKEQAAIGSLMGASPLPETAQDLSTWVSCHPSIGHSKAMREAIAFLNRPPLPRVEYVGYKILQRAAAATIPRGLRKTLDLNVRQSSVFTGRVLLGALRWALRFSPAWKAALLRCGVNFDRNMFREDA